MANITKTITYDLPDKWQEESTALGKTSTQTYTGPAIVVAVVQKNDVYPDGRVVNSYNKEREDGRPLAADFEYVDIDCDKNPLHCGILWGGFEPPAHFEVEVGPVDRLNPTVSDPTHPSEVFDIMSFTDGWDGSKWKPIKFATPEPDDPDMDAVRRARNGLLEHTDHRLTHDMPEDVQAEWIAYRQRLRDLPGDYPEGTPPYLMVLPPAPREANQNSEMQPDEIGVMLSNEDAGEGVIPISEQDDRTDWQGQLPPGIASAD
jgi:hypothetical protein